MSPEELQQLKQKVDRIDAGFRNLSQLDPQFVKSLIDLVKNNINLTDLKDVDTSGVSDGKVIKYQASTGLWVDAVDA